MAKRYPVMIQEILDIQKRRQQINRLKLSDIDFIDNRLKVVKISPTVIKDFEFTGLNNTDFITCGCFRQKSLWSSKKDRNPK